MRVLDKKNAQKNILTINSEKLGEHYFELMSLKKVVQLCQNRVNPSTN